MAGYIDWTKIVANGGVAFFTTLTGISLAGITDAGEAMRIALIPALIQAGLAFFVTLKTEAEDKPTKNPRGKLLKAMTLF